MKIPCKGTTLALGAGGVLVTVAQVIEADIGAQDPEVFDADTLDNPEAGMPQIATGRTAQADSSFNYFYDPALHTALADYSQNPGNYQQRDSSSTITGEFRLVDDAETAITFVAAAVAMGQIPLRMNDGMKCSGAIKHSGLVHYPEA